MPNRDTQENGEGALGVLVLVHVSILAIGVPWAFGGNADWVRTPIALWGTLGILIFAASLIRGRIRKSMDPRVLLWAMPVGVLNLLVIASCLRPGLRSLPTEQGFLQIPMRMPYWVPSSATPGVSAAALWLFDGLYLSALNVALFVKGRRSLRLLLTAIVTNTLALSLFGMAQKFAGSKGIYFGAFATPNEHFFSSFVYDNHWGAFTLLASSACVGLVIRYSSGADGRGLFHGPALTGLIAFVLIAASVPLSGSRACSLLQCLMAVAAVMHGAPRISRALAYYGLGSRAALVGLALACVAAIAVTWFIAGPAIEARLRATRAEIPGLVSHGSIGSRRVVYRDTLQMASKRPVFGWGMGSYPTVFTLFNTQSRIQWYESQNYHDAHSDWLQSLAEIGIAGTAMIGCAALLPLWHVRRLKFTVLPRFVLFGCALVAAYAWIEFPFGNVAVVTTWWVCLMTAVSYMRLGYGRSREN